MSRLTKKSGNDYTYKNKYNQAYHKLGKLENIEEEIGCPLEVLVKAIAQGYVYELDDEEFRIGKTVSKKNIEGVSKTHCYTPNFWCFLIAVDNIYLTIRLSNYKKTWWLKENKSE